MDQKRSKGIIAKVIFPLSGILLFFLSGFFFYQLGRSSFRLFPEFFRDTAPKVDISSLVVKQIRSSSELTTVVFITETIVPTSMERKLAGQVTIGTTKLLYIARGEVRAGFDLNRIGKNSLRLTPHEIRLQLPPPQVIDSKLDLDHSYVYDYERGLLGPDVAPKLQTLAQKRALEKIVASACATGLLEEANQRAEAVFGKLFQVIEGRRVIVTLSPPADPRCRRATSSKNP
jgi:hypothetical protein